MAFVAAFIISVLSIFLADKLRPPLSELGFSRLREQSAGGGFAVAVLMVSFGFFCLVSMLIALFVKIPKFELFKKIQVCLCGILGAVTVIAVVLLEQRFPAYP